VATKDSSAIFDGARDEQAPDRVRGHVAEGENDSAATGVERFYSDVKRVVVPDARTRVLVRPVHQVDGCRRSRDATMFNRPLPGGYFRSDDGPSGAVARSKVDAVQDWGLPKHDQQPS